ncbi:MAG: GTP cyclohydrolase I [candidate division KSB1 bacterium]|nr:GTP cyclohydrolase I [candidate division KSB1 bacterium]
MGVASTPLMKALQPAGVAVVTEARHLCMMMRGVQKQNTVVTSSALLGVFHEDRAWREEFMQQPDTGRWDNLQRFL